MRKILAGLGAAFVLVLAGCGGDPGPDPTVPPQAPSHSIAGSTLPAKVSAYTALGSAPRATDITATYAADTDPLNLAVVSFDATGDFGTTYLTDQVWYGMSRCGILWRGDSNQTPRVEQAACITVLTDGVMTTVAGGRQTPEELSVLANAIHSQLA
ncbi:MAG: hypothetical protein LBN10_01770 [Propionibacteriaceae bacterium]|jgi:hypothetical protein|nr:hypothetical protein [Propionibacteriaceae bacterium]